MKPKCVPLATSIARSLDASCTGVRVRDLACLPGRIGAHQSRLIAYKQVGVDETQAGEQVYLQ